MKEFLKESVLYIFGGALIVLLVYCFYLILFSKSKDNPASPGKKTTK